jgi:hypothetical protein
MGLWLDSGEFTVDTMFAFLLPQRSAVWESVPTHQSKMF